MNVTANTDIVYALCVCCAAHGGGDKMISPPIPCAKCGQMCSCEGCQADAADPGSMTVPPYKLPPGDYLPDNYRPLKLADEQLRGWDVYSIQTGFNLLGESLKEDGIFGDRTEEAVEAFQGEHGLTTDKICGGVTMAVLSSAAAHRLNRKYKLPKGIPYGHFEHESSNLPPNFTAPYLNGTRDLGVVQENTAFYAPEHAFDVRAAGNELCERIVTYHARYVGWGVADNLAWRYACGSWNAPAWTDKLAKGEPLADADRQAILAYIDSVIAYTTL